MERLEGHVRSELGRIAPAEGDLVAIVRAWPAAVGETLARNAWPARLQRDGTLLVHTVSATWAFELGRMAADVLERLRAEAGGASPPALRFVPGPVPEAPAEAAPAEAEGPVVGPEDAAEAARIAAPVANEELRRLVARAAAASLAKARAEAVSDRGF